MAFTAKDVQALREKTGAGMMDCKKALVESDGDMDKAIDVLRERGLAAATKKASRIAAEGVVYAQYNEAAKVGVIVEVNSETDFVAKNDKFMALVKGVAETIADKNPADVDALTALNFAGSDRTVAETFQEAVLSIGENMKIRRFARVEGIVSTYIHMGGAVGVMAVFEADEATAAKAEFKEMGKNVAMQIAAMAPQYLCPCCVPEDVVAHEKEINLAQMKEDPKMANKPAAVLDKIIDGKIAKFYKEVCLLDQEFVRSDIFEGDIKGYVAKVAKDMGAEIKLVNFFRFAKGEGLQKKEDDFAAEVASMVK